MNKFYCVLGALILTLNSCSEKGQIAPPNVEITNIGKDVTFKDGRLVFKDSLAYNQHLNWIVQNANNPFEIKQFNNQIGLASLNSIYEAGGNIQNHDDFTKYVDCNKNAYNVVDFDNSFIYERSCPLIISFLGNQDGLFQIGDQLCRYSGSYLLTTTDKTQSTIKQLFLPISEISKGKITVNDMLYIPEGSTKGQWLLGKLVQLHKENDVAGVLGLGKTYRVI